MVQEGPGVAIAMDIYEKIRYYQAHTDYSQRTVARMLGISRNTVKKYWNPSRAVKSCAARCLYWQYSRNSNAVGTPDVSIRFLILSVRLCPEFVRKISGIILFTV